MTDVTARELLALVLDELEVLIADLADSTAQEYVSGAGFVRIAHRGVAATATRLGLLPAPELLPHVGVGAALNGVEHGPPWPS